MLRLVGEDLHLLVYFLRAAGGLERDMDRPLLTWRDAVRVILGDKTTTRSGHTRDFERRIARVADDKCVLHLVAGPDALERVCGRVALVTGTAGRGGCCRSGGRGRGRRSGECVARGEQKQ